MRRRRNSSIREKLHAFLRATLSASFLGTFPIKGKAYHRGFSLRRSSAECGDEVFMAQPIHFK